MPNIPRRLTTSTNIPWICAIGNIVGYQELRVAKGETESLFVNKTNQQERLWNVSFVA
jgi:hypothetical protein